MSMGTLNGINLDSSSSSYYKAGPIDNPGQASDDLQSLNNNGNNVELEEITVRGSDYNFSEASYPDGVGSDMDKQHYIRFFINMRGKSKFLKGSKAKIREDLKSAVSPDDVNFQNQRALQQKVVETSEGNVAKSGLATAGGKVGATVLGAIGLINRSGLGTLVGGGIGTVLGAEASNKISEATGAVAEVFDDIREDVPRRITDVITLHIQDRPAVNYSVGYTEDEVGILGGLLAGTDISNINNLEDVKDLAKDVGAPAVLQLMQTIGGLGGSFGGTLNARRLLESGIKNKTNPFREQFFERVDFRTFNFRHTFMPKNPSEVMQVKKIIDLFKFHMHPELAGEKNLMFLYPSEFDIKYMYRQNENNYFNKFTTCVLEDMNVEYGGDIFPTFEDGEPVEVLTKENIQTRGL